MTAAEITERMARDYNSFRFSDRTVRTEATPPRPDRRTLGRVVDAARRAGGAVAAAFVSLGESYFPIAPAEQQQLAELPPEAQVVPRPAPEA